MDEQFVHAAAVALGLAKIEPESFNDGAFWRDAIQRLARGIAAIAEMHATLERLASCPYDAAGPEVRICIDRARAILVKFELNDAN